MIDFTRRATEPEQMDADDLPADRYAAVLRDLARVNRIIRSAAPTLQWLDGVTRDAPRTLMDVGFGQGDMLRAIAQWARRHGRRLHLHGADINPRSAPIASALSRGSDSIRYHTGQAAQVAASLDHPPDLIISSLVAHHMTDDELVAFLQWMEASAEHGWFISDLHRHPVAWYGFRLLAWLMRVDPTVRHDGALSVRRAFTRSDWERLLRRAGIPRDDVTIRWAIPFRWAVGRQKTVPSTRFTPEVPHTATSSPA